MSLNNPTPNVKICKLLWFHSFTIQRDRVSGSLQLAQQAEVFE